MITVRDIKSNKVTMGIACGVVLLLMWLLVFGPGGLLVAHNHNNLLRLHVVANSNSVADQELKLAVRDALIPMLQELMNGVTTATEAEAVLSANQEALVQQAAAVVSAHGYTYPVRVELGVFDYPRKTSDTVTLPPGSYRAVNVTIGAGAGRNWWCILFPPLCFQPQSVQVASSTPTADSGKQVKLINWRWRLIEQIDGVAYAAPTAY